MRYQHTYHSSQAGRLGLEAQVYLEYPIHLVIHGLRVYPDLLAHLVAHQVQAFQVHQGHLSLQAVLSAVAMQNVQCINQSIKQSINQNIYV